MPDIRMRPAARPLAVAGLALATLTLSACRNGGTTTADRGAPTSTAPPIGTTADSNSASVVEVSSAAAPAAAAPAPASPIANGGETFDAAWELVRDTHFDPELGGTDWDAVRVELRPRAVAATSNDELRLVVQDMVSRLGDSHFGVIPAEQAAPMAAPPPSTGAGATGAAGATGSDEATTTAAGGGSSSVAGDSSPDAGPGSTGMEVRLVGEEVLVSRVVPRSAAADAGIEPGWMLLTVNGRPVDRIMAAMTEADDRFGAFEATMVVHHMLDGPTGSTANVEMVDGAGRIAEIALVREPVSGEAIKFGTLPTMYAELEARPARPMELRAAKVDVTPMPSVGLIRFNVWMVPVARPFHEAVDRFREADAIVIDLRGNPGGVGALAMGMAGHFCDDRESLGSFKSRQTNLEFKVNPRRTTADGELTVPYDGPVAILVDDMTASTSEIFAGGLQSMGRARVFGTRTAGAALPAHMTKLPNGDSLLHAVADFILPDGSRIEGQGVIPDEEIPLTQTDLLAGRDAALLAALRWATDEARTTPSTTG